MDLEKIRIREAVSTDLEAVLNINRIAFGEEDEAKLVADLLGDNSALPLVSLVAIYNNKAIAHILFTRCWLETNTKTPFHILAPMAVLPQFQGKGIGGSLIKNGIQHLRKQGTELVFVLGHKAYYPKYGFIPDAGALGLHAPYSIPEKDADAWMAQALTKEALNKYEGKIQVAKTMMKPEYWVE